MFSIDKLILSLKSKYKNTDFLFKDDGLFLKLLYSNKELINDDMFFDFTYQLSEKFLSEEDRLRLAVVYDYLNEINVNMKLK